MDKTDNDGKDYEYSVKEFDELNGNIKIGNAWYKVTYEGDAQKGFIIKNKKLPPLTPMIPPTREIKVTKLWKDHNGSTIAAPTDKITVELYRDGKATGKTVELNAQNKWTFTFKNLEVADMLGSTNYYNYTVKEVGESGNIIKIDTEQYKVIYEGSTKDGITITNEKETPPNPPTPKTPPNPKGNLPKTGDGTNLSLYAWAMLLSGIALVLIEYRCRKHAK